MNEPEFLSEADLERLGLARKQTWSKWRMSGRGPRFYKINGSVRYKRSDVEEFLAACAKTPDGRDPAAA